MILKNNKLIFIHVPKCAGTSIENALKESLSIDDENSGLFKYRFIKNLGFIFHSHHLTLQEHQQAFLEKTETQNFNVICVVRNPLDRFLSFVKWAKLPNQRKLFGYKPSVQQWIRIFKSGISFKNIPLFDFIENHRLPQHKYLKTISPFKSIKIFKFENLNKGSLNDYMEELNIKSFNLKFDNVSAKRVFKDHEIKQASDFVQDYYAEDFIKFGYEK